MKTLATVQVMCKDGLNAVVTLDDLADFFKLCRTVKIKEWTTRDPYLLGKRNRKTQRPWCYSVLWRSAKTAIEWFDWEILRDSLTKRKLPMNIMWEGMTHCEDRGMPLPPEEVLGPWRSWRTHGSHGRLWSRQGAFPHRRPWGFQGNPSWRGDCKCPDSGCGRQNLTQSATSLRPQHPNASTHHLSNS